MTAAILSDPTLTDNQILDLYALWGLMRDDFYIFFPVTFTLAELAGRVGESRSVDRLIIRGHLREKKKSFDDGLVSPRRDNDLRLNISKGCHPVILRPSIRSLALEDDNLNTTLLLSVLLCDRKRPLNLSDV